MSDRDRQTLSTHFTFYLSIVFGREYLRPFCMYTESVLSLASGWFGSAGDAQNVSGSPQYSCSGHMSDAKLGWSSTSNFRRNPSSWGQERCTTKIRELTILF